MSAIDDIEAAIRRQRDENAAAIQAHRADSKALADMTQKLEAALNGQVTDVDIARLAAEINAAAQDLHNGISSTHTDAVGAKTANAGTSAVSGGNTSGADVVSASSPGVVVPTPSDTEASNAVPESLGGGAMPRTDATGGSMAEKAPGTPLPPTAPEPEEKAAEPAVPGIEDVPSKVSDEAKGGTKG